MRMAFTLRPLEISGIGVYLSELNIVSRARMIWSGKEGRERSDHFQQMASARSLYGCLSEPWKITPLAS